MSNRAGSMKNIHKYTLNPHKFVRSTPARLIVLLLVLCSISSITLFTPMFAKAAGASSPTFTQFPIPNIGVAGDITSGPDGNLWFIDGSESNSVASYIVRVTPSGTITEYTVPTPTSANFVFPTNITSGPDGDLWFDMLISNANGSTSYDIASVTTSGTFTEFPLPSGWAAPGNTGNITGGPDGNIWFIIGNCGTENPGNGIGRMTPSGVFTEFPLSTTSCPSSITSGSDGNVWFTLAGNIGRITPSGTISEFPLPGTNPGASDIITGPGGNLWFIAGNGETNGIPNTSIGRITPSGTISEFPLPSGDSPYTGPYSIAAGSDGNVWFTYMLTDSAGSSQFDLDSISPDGTINKYPLPASTIAGFSLFLPTYYMTSGSDGNLWLTANNVGVDNGVNQSVVRVDIAGATTTPPQPPPPPTTSSTDTGFRPSKDGFGFCNYGQPNTSCDYQYYTNLSLASFEQFFGKQNVLTSNGQLRAAVQPLYDESQYMPLSQYTTYTGQGDYEHAAWDGRCFGFSGAALVNFLHLDQSSAGSFALPAGQYASSSITPSDVPAGSSTDLGDTLGYYDGVQLGAEAYSVFTQTINESEKDPSAILAQIEQSINDGQPIQVGINKYSYATSDGTSYPTAVGHSLVAYSYELTSTGALVNVYDSNHPDDDNEQIVFNTQNNTWLYNPLNDSNGPWASFQDNGALSLFTAEDYTQQGILPWSSNSLLTMNAQSTTGITITNSGGQVMGLQNGSLVNQMDNAAIIPVSSDSTPTDSGLTYTLPLNNPYTIQVSNIVGKDEPVNMYANGTYVSVSGLTPSKGDSATLALGADDKSVAVSSSAKVTNYSITLDQETSTSSLTYTISGASLNPGEKTTFALIGDNGQLQIKNSGTDKTYTVTMQETGGNDSTLTERNIALGSDATDTWMPSDWNNLSTAPVDLTVDQNSDGTSVSTVVANAVNIDNGDQYTQSNKVTLGLAPPFTAAQMRVSDSPFDKNNKYWPAWQKFSSTKTWQLPGWDGKHTVYVQYKATDGTVSNIYSSSIVLDNIKPQIYWVSINNGRSITQSTTVQLHISAWDYISGIQSMRVSNSNDLSGATWQPYTSSFSWTLAPLSGIAPQHRWVYIQVEDGAGNVSRVFKSSVWLLP